MTKEKEDYQVVPIASSSRFAITDATGKIVDDAQGYGYKTKQSAVKAMNYKFRGGKQKSEETAADFRNWSAANPTHNIVRMFNRYIEACFKEISRGETKTSDIWKSIEEDIGTGIPQPVRSHIERQ